MRSAGKGRMISTSFEHAVAKACGLQVQEDCGAQEQREVQIAHVSAFYVMEAFANI